MFFRLKKSGERVHVQIVENKRDGRPPSARVIANVGRADEDSHASARSPLSSLRGPSSPIKCCSSTRSTRTPGAAVGYGEAVGGPMLFGRIWERLGVADVLTHLLKERVRVSGRARAVFVAALHRLFVSGSDRDCWSWMEDARRAVAEGLDLHHFYCLHGLARRGGRGEAGKGWRPRCVKDLIEEKLFDRRRDLFTDLSIVFMDTTSLSFYGEGGETLGEHGYSKDYRPDLKQMILDLVVDGDGRPIYRDVAGEHRRRDVTRRCRWSTACWKPFHRPGLRRRRPRHRSRPQPSPGWRSTSFAISTASPRRASGIAAPTGSCAPTLLPPYYAVQECPHRLAAARHPHARPRRRPG